MSSDSDKSEKIGPWQRCVSRTVYENPWIRVDHDEVLTPAGTQGIYGRIHFKNLAVGIVPMDTQHNTWLVGQHRYSLDEYSWEIPMGGCPLGTDPLLTAQRELREETGLSAQSWRLLQKVHTSNSVTDELGYIYVAENLSEGSMALDDTEDIQVMKLPFVEALQMALDGRITDCMSITALFRLALEFQGNRKDSGL